MIQILDIDESSAFNAPHEKATGTNAVIIKGGQGMLAYNCQPLIDQCKAAGLPYGIYWLVDARYHSTDHSTADNTSMLFIPIRLPQNSVAYKGSMLNSIDIWYFVGTAAAIDITPVIQKLTYPATGGAIPTIASPAPVFTYDAGHTTPALRLALSTGAWHKMTLTPTTPFFVDDDDQVYVELVANNDTTTVFKIAAVRVNFTLRM